MTARGGKDRQKKSVPSQKDDLLALALARGQTQADAADSAGVASRTVSRRLDDPAFRAMVDQLRSRLLDRAVGKLAGSADRAIERLLELLDDPKAIVRFRAAKALLDQCVKFTSFHDLARQVADIQAALKARGHS